MLFADGLTRLIRKVSSSCSAHIPFADFPLLILTFRGLPLAGNKVTRRGMGPDNEHMRVDSARFSGGAANDGRLFYRQFNYRPNAQACDLFTQQCKPSEMESFACSHFYWSGAALSALTL